MSVPAGKTTAQRTRCALTRMVVSSVFVWTAPKSLMLHMSRHHRCEHYPYRFFSKLMCRSFSTEVAQCQANMGIKSSTSFTHIFLLSFNFSLFSFIILQALWTKPLSCGQQSMFSGPELLLLPLPGSCVQSVSSSRHVQSLSFASNRWDASLLFARRKASSAPLHGPAVRPSDRSADAGEPSAGPRNSGGRGGDEWAGETSPAGEVHHQSHHVCFPVWILKEKREKKRYLLHKEEEIRWWKVDNKIALKLGQTKLYSIMCEGVVILFMILFYFYSGFSSGAVELEYIIKHYKPL